MAARIAIIGGVALSAMAGANVDYRRLRVTSLQPRNEAFGIWAVIYGLLVATAAASPYVPRWPSVALVASLLATCVWAATVAHSPPSIALVALGCACAGAWYGLATWPRSDMLASTALGLYAGWLSVACMLGTATVATTIDTPLTFFATAGAVVCASAVLRTPTPVLSVVWAAAMQKK